jgi:hypothetical protein
MVHKAALPFIAVLLTGPVLAQETGSAALSDPISGIDWLSESIRPGNQLVVPKSQQSVEGVFTDVISVTSLDLVQKDAVGLLPPEVSGLPRNFWSDSPPDKLRSLLRPHFPEALPEVSALFHRILIAELDAPAGSGKEADLLLARLDHLLEAGALDQADALIERAGPTEPALFRRWFDISLLTQRAERACVQMLATPSFAPTLPARVFCLARRGDWNAAALTLATGEALGRITTAEADLLTWFLDPVLFEGEPDLPAPARMTPLIFTMREAIGQTRSGPSLPLAFLHGDLKNQNGWKNRLSAAERLAREHAVSPDFLLNIYLEGAASASGGVWARVEAIQRLTAALNAGEPGEISQALTVAYAEMAAARLEFVLAELFAGDLAGVALRGQDREIQMKLALLHPDFSTLADALVPDTPQQKFLLDIATGRQLAPQSDAIASAIRDAFEGAAVSGPTADLLAKGRVGEAVLQALHMLMDPAPSDPNRIRTALFTLRQAGLEQEARRIALQILILDRRA